MNYSAKITSKPIIFLFIKIKGEKQLTLQNGGWGTCAVPFKTGFVTIGGCCDYHGKVDRCSNRHCHHLSLSVRGTTLKANTWVSFPTWPHLDMCTPAQVFWWTASRWKYPKVVQLSFFCISNRPCLLLEATVMSMNRAPRFTIHQQIDGQEEETLPGENIC